uniref:Bestrophin homolog n=1 Tax=Ascaris lumbricoides TaxID=6252 RepID=A0A0M3I128_ASCLU
MGTAISLFLNGETFSYQWSWLRSLFEIKFCVDLSNVLLQLRTVKNFVLDIQSMYSYDEGKKRKLYLLLFISFTQPFIMWWLTSDVTAFMPRKLGFAQLALSGMGLNEAVSKGQVPLLPDGEVDYEALLKMP